MGSLLMTLLGVSSCRDATPEPKVKRWATPEDFAAPADTMLSDEDAQALVAKDPTPLLKSAPVSPQRDACDKLISAACEALGPYSEECGELRKRVPKERGEHFESACTALLKDHVFPPPRNTTRMNPCRRLMSKICKIKGPRSQSCKRTRADANKLWIQGRGHVCLGELLGLELKTLFGADLAIPASPELLGSER